MESIVRPVYFCQSYTTPDGELITWKYRPDTAYRGVSIRNAEGTELAFAAYPENKWRITDKTLTEVCLVSVGETGDTAGAEKVSLPGILPLQPEDVLPVRPQIRIVPDENGAYFSKGGRKYTVNGFNFIGLSGGDHSTFEPFAYDPYTAETMLFQMQKKGYNTVRVFIMGGRQAHIPGISCGQEHNDRSFDRTYMGNVIHFLRLCRKYDFALLPNFGDNELPGNRFYQTLSGGCDRTQVMFHKGAVEAKSIMVEEFLTEIRDADPALLHSLFAVQLQNEFHFSEAVLPFSQTQGIYRLYDGTEYDMAKDADRRALADHAAMLYFTKLRETVKSVSPELLLCEGTFTMYAVGKTMETAYGFRTGHEDYRVPLSGLEYLQMPLDFVDIHVYCEDTDEAALKFEENFHNMLLDTEEAGTLLQQKPVIMGEFSSFKPNRRTGDFAMGEKNILTLRDKAMENGFAGFLHWTIDSFWQPELWHMMEDGGSLADRLSLLHPDRTL